MNLWTFSFKYSFGYSCDDQCKENAKHIDSEMFQSVGEFRAKTKIRGDKVH